MKTIASALGATLAVLAIALGGAYVAAILPTTAATPVASAPCVPSDAWTETTEHPRVSHEETTTVVDREAYDEDVFVGWQRYSWTGGPHESDSPPPFPSSDWQANVQGDPHGVGVEGPYFRSHGNSGRGDWFYLEAVHSTQHYDAVTHDETVVVIDSEAWTETTEHPAVACIPTVRPSPTGPPPVIKDPIPTVDPTRPPPTWPAPPVVDPTGPSTIDEPTDGPTRWASAHPHKHVKHHKVRHLPNTGG